MGQGALLLVSIPSDLSRMLALEHRRPCSLHVRVPPSCLDEFNVQSESLVDVRRLRNHHTDLHYSGHRMQHLPLERSEW